jgi:hypothetical protein
MAIVPTEKAELIADWCEVPNQFIKPTRMAMLYKYICDSRLMKHEAPDCIYINTDNMMILAKAFYEKVRDILLKRDKDCDLYYLDDYFKNAYERIQEDNKNDKQLNNKHYDRQRVTNIRAAQGRICEAIAK